MKININFKNLMLAITSIVVAGLVIIAIYSNRNQFQNPVVLRYKQISIEHDKDIYNILENYSDIRQKDKFISEVKKINNINSFDNITKKTIIIPIVN